MADGLKEGLTTTVRYEVDPSRTIGHMGDDLAVYSTPSMVNDIEMTCQAFLQEFLEDSQNTVGTHVSVDHMAPTPGGAWVEVSITVTAVEGRMVSMDAIVKDPIEQVGRGKHSRFIVDNAKTAERLRAKRDQINQGG